VLSDHATGAVDVRISSGQPTFDIRPDVAWDHIPATSTAREVATQANAIAFGTLAQRSRVSRASIRELLRLPEKECLRICDVNLRHPYYDDSVIRDSLAEANVLKLNDVELPIVLEALGCSAGHHWPARLFGDEPQLRLIALTRGEHGSTLFTPQRIEGHTLAAKNVAIKDTVGAGDAFTAALATGLLRARPLEELHHHAVHVAAYLCTQSGATPRIPRELTGGV
jgi:fructokinase